jgi:DNA-directed RNA polymerase subunit M/transcription elongation factor TFIIS
MSELKVFEDAIATTCPRCGHEKEDFDGFGFLACESCGFCTHPSEDGDGEGNWICGICGRKEPDNT